MMATVGVVTELPMLDQAAFPELPADFSGKYFLLFGSKWNHAEEERAAGLLMTAAARRHKWEPIPWSDFEELVKKNPGYLMFMDYGIGEAFHKIADAGDVQLVTMNGVPYVIPNPSFGQAMRDCKVRYDEEPPLQQEVPEKAEATK